MKLAAFAVLGAGLALSACTVNNYYYDKAPPPPPHAHPDHAWDHRDAPPPPPHNHPGAPKPPKPLYRD